MLISHAKFEWTKAKAACHFWFILVTGVCWTYVISAINQSQCQCHWGTSVTTIITSYTSLLSDPFHPDHWQEFYFAAKSAFSCWSSVISALDTNHELSKTVSEVLPVYLPLNLWYTTSALLLWKVEFACVSDVCYFLCARCKDTSKSGLKFNIMAIFIFSVSIPKNQS